MRKPLVTFNAPKFEQSCDIVFYILFALKLAQLGYPADWSWWWIFAPLYIGYALSTLLNAWLPPPTGQAQANTRIGLP